MNNDEQPGAGCLSAILQLLGLGWFLGWASRKDQQAQDRNFRTMMAMHNAENAAREWNAAEQEGYLDDEQG